MKEDTVENINRDLLMKMIGDYEYLAVFFCKFLKTFCHTKYLSLHFAKSKLFFPIFSSLCLDVLLPHATQLDNKLKLEREIEPPIFCAIF